MRHTGFGRPQLGFASFLVGTNAVLYLQGNAVTIKQHRWKWLMLVLMLIAPIPLAPFIPYPPQKLVLRGALADFSRTQKQ
jgi:hypothetical protein